MSYLDKCTDGEWIVFDDGLNGFGISTTEEDAPFFIAHVGIESDAHLMAASKKMYEALDELKSMLSTLMENSNIRMIIHDDDEYDEAIEKANLALKAARGEK